MPRPPAALLAAALLAVAPAVAAAQAGPAGPGGQTPANDSTLSPYLGLLNGTNGTAFNYYEFVRPQQRFSQQIGSLNADLRATRNQLSATRSLLTRQPQVGARLVGATGHATAFGSTRGYFPGRRN